MTDYKTTEQVKKEQGFLGICDLDNKPHRFNQFMHGPRGRGHCVNFKVISNLVSPEEKENVNLIIS